MEVAWGTPSTFVAWLHYFSNTAQITHAKFDEIAPCPASLPNGIIRTYERVKFPARIGWYRQNVNTAWPGPTGANCIHCIWHKVQRQSFFLPGTLTRMFWTAVSGPPLISPSPKQMDSDIYFSQSWGLPLFHSPLVDDWQSLVRRI